jgi:ABC-type transport system involved in cytochrome c biogenesis permease subunit
MQTTVEVNRPVEVEGWKIYQYGYDTQKGVTSRISVLELVSDPWLPLVYAGIFMMMTGVMLLLTYTRWNYRRLLPTVALTVAALGIVSYFMPVIRSTHLIPVLQSPWFMPHILAYIVCYSLMGVAAVIAVYILVFGRKTILQSCMDACKNRASILCTLNAIVYAGFGFMTFGMVFGAFWAKDAWGDCWSWDPKETWAAITWLAYLVYIHYCRLPNHNPRLALWLVIGAFALLQMCWWGINYLPAAQGVSIHVY